MSPVRMGEAISVTLHSGAESFPLALKGGTAKLDSGWAPFVQADLTIAAPMGDALEALDPRTAARPRITIEHQVAGQARSYDLMLRSRALGYLTAELQIGADSDEAMLQDLSNASAEVDVSARAHQASLRELIGSWLLPKIGAELEPGDADADVTTTTEVTNLLLNPSAEVDASNWIAATAISSLVRSTAQHYTGTACIAATASGANPAWFPFEHATSESAVSTSAGQEHTFSVRIRSSIVRLVFVTLRFYNSAGAQVGVDVMSPTINTSTTAWSYVGITAVAPAGATGVIGFIRSPAAVAGDVFYSDGAMLVEGDGLDTDGTALEPIDGSLPADAHYVYSWSGAAHASTSKRTPLVDRDPDSLAWQPGQSAWDLVTPVVTAAGKRLFCDEQRRWRLVSSDYQTGGALTIARARNLEDGTDTIDLADDDGWFDSVVVQYTWTDQTGTQQTRYDIALPDLGTPTRTRLVQRSTPFPGPGAAAYILKRQQGKGHQLSPRAISDLTASPYRPVVVVAPDTPTLTGIVSAVSFDLAADSMDVTTAGLTDTPDNAIVLAPTGLRIIDIPAGTIINDLVWSDI